MNTWVLYVALYGVIKGCREICKKKALSISTIAEVLFFYAALGFLLVIPTVRANPFVISGQELFLIAVKSVVIFAAWLCGFAAIRQIPVGLYGVLDMARLLFSTVLAVLFLSERLTALEICGYVLVVTGLVAVNFVGGEKGGRVRSPKAVLLVLGSCLLNAVSGLLDKVVTRSLDTGVLQLWYMLFLAILYLVYLLIREHRVDFRILLRNPWVIVLSVIFIIGDRALFLANADPASKISVMNLIKQCSVLVVIVLGHLVYHEKRLWPRLCCAGVILAGIVVSTI